MTARRPSSMRGELREVKKALEAPAKRALNVRDWFVGESAEHIARRAEVWGLIRWYHERYVLPNMGLRGFIRRMWIRLTGHKINGVNVDLLALTSPWENYEVRKRLQEAMAQLERCPIGFLEEGKTEAVACELPAGHEGHHQAGSFTWADDQAAQTPRPPGPEITA